MLHLQCLLLHTDYIWRRKILSCDSDSGSTDTCLFWATGKRGKRNERKRKAGTGTPTLCACAFHSTSSSRRATYIIMLRRRVWCLISLRFNHARSVKCYENVKAALCSQHMHLLISEFEFDLCMSSFSSLHGLTVD